MSQYFPKPYEPFGGDINVIVDLSNYATKIDIKNISHVDTSSFALKTNLTSLKSEVDKLDIDKLKPVPTDLSKLSNVLKNDVFKKEVYDKLVTKVNSIDTSGFAINNKYDTDKSELENKIPDVRGFATKTQLITIENKITSASNIASKSNLTAVENKIPDISNLATKTALTTIENKIPDISNLATKTALTSVENKIPDVNSLIKRTNYNTKITEIDTKLLNLGDKITKNDLIKIISNTVLFFWGEICYLIVKMVFKLT